jgi:hypothetical protein
MVVQGTDSATDDDEGKDEMVVQKTDSPMAVILHPWEVNFSLSYYHHVQFRNRMGWCMDDDDDGSSLDESLPQRDAV